MTVRLLLALTAIQGWQVHEVDIINAYFHGFLDEEIYLIPPEGYNKDSDGLVCKLSNTLYGLKQAGRQWHKELSSVLISYGFSRSTHDNCLFLKGNINDTSFLAIVIYVDDILVCGSQRGEIEAFKQKLHSLYTIKDLGQAKFFLGIEIIQSKPGIFLAQTKYIADMLTDAGLAEVNIASSPFSADITLHKEGTYMENPDSYKRLVGKLFYLGFTRRDISHITQQLS